MDPTLPPADPAAPAVLLVTTTFAHADDARRVGRALVERGLAACAQLEPIESLYLWEGALQHESEVRLLLKTVPARWTALEAALRELHPYTLPAIVAWRCDAVHAPFAAWVAAGSGGPPPGRSG